jgi:hypothetical protein
MATFLIQVSGEKAKHNETSSDYWWEEPIKENVYIYYHWTRTRELKESWKKAKQGDRILIYCTGSVKPYPKQISHVGEIQKVELDEDKAKMILSVEKLTSGVPLNIIQNEMEAGNLSEKMGRCGTHGFNMGEVEDSDFDRIKELAIEAEDIKARVRAEKEIEIQRYFEANIQAIEEGLHLVEKDDVLPQNAGEPDLICKDRDGNYVVIELKAGKAGYNALGQVISYKSAIKERTNRKVRGILIAHDFDPKISFAPILKDSDGVSLVEFKKYNLKVELVDMDMKEEVKWER